LIIDVSVTDENIIHKNFILIENLLVILPLFGQEKAKYHLLLVIIMKRKKTFFPAII